MQVAVAAAKTVLQCKLKAASLFILPFADAQLTLAAYTLQMSLERKDEFHL